MLRTIFQKQILISHSPNTEVDDVIASLRGLISLNPKDALSQVKQRLNELFAYKNVYLFDSGRSSIFVALKAVGIKQGDEVIMQGFNCIAVYNAIKWTGATPVITDINRSNLNLELKSVLSNITNNTRAIIVQHTFGVPAEIDKFMELGREKGILIIEDCSHMVGNKYHDRFTGSIGDFGILSFGRDKAFSSGAGGALIVNNSKFKLGVEQHYDKLSNPPFLWRKREILYPIISIIFIRPLYYRLNIGKILLFLGQKIRLISKSTSKSEKLCGVKPDHMPAKLSPDLAYMLHNQLNKYEKYQTHRMNLARIYFQSLQEYCPFDKEVVDNNYLLRFPLLTNDSDELIYHFHKLESTSLGDWYNQIIGPREVDLVNIEYGNDCSVAESICSQIVNLPLNINTSQLSARLLVDKILKYMKNQNDQRNK